MKVRRELSSSSGCNVSWEREESMKQTGRKEEGKVAGQAGFIARARAC